LIPAGWRRVYRREVAKPLSIITPPYIPGAFKRGETPISLMGGCGGKISQGDDTPGVR